MSGVTAQGDLLRCCYVMVPLPFHLPQMVYRVHVKFLYVDGPSKDGLEDFVEDLFRRLVHTAMAVTMPAAAYNGDDLVDETFR